jgi:RHS repeat-associated protein
MTDATGSSSYIYDPFGELTSATNGADQAVGYSYDADGDTTGITYPLSAAATWATTDTVSYGYDHADNLTSVTDFNSHQISITPNADSLPSSETLGSSGDTISTTYDPTDTPSAITLKNSSSTLQSFTYSDAPAGNILSETDTPSSSQSPADYTYDAQDRVTSMTPGTSSTRNYGFDASGNLTTLPGGAAGTYDHDSELTSSVLSGTTTSFTYNADGERLTAKQGSTTTASATWNGAAELTTYADNAANMTAATYDGNGLRASATTTPSGGSASTQNFVWNTTTSVPHLLMDSINAYIYGDGAAPAEQVNLSTGAISYLVTDSLGSVRGVVSSTGALTATASYDAWGNPETAGGVYSYSPFGYAGAYADATGLLYLINRYYDPVTGQFVSIDPEISQTNEPYQYADDNPVDHTDHAGLYPDCGPGVPELHVVANYKMKRVEGGYREVPLYCGNAKYGFRHLEPHIGQYFGGWPSFNFAISVTLRAPADITYRAKNDTYTHLAPVYQCFYEGYYRVWTFRVVTAKVSGKIITAYGEPGETVDEPCV